jgi:Protein of unknown function (DUF4242)
VAKYLVEAYLPELRASELRQAVARLRSAAKELTGEGTPVRHLRVIFVPEDELCFHLFEGPSADAVGEAGRRGGLDFERVVEAAT